MTDTLRITPRYIRNTDAFGWQGADKPDGPWRSITPPQTGTPLQTAAPVDELCQASAETFGIAELSPAEQVMIAVTRIYQEHGGEPPARAVATAALRAAAEQAIPLIKTPWGTTLVPVLTSLESRDRFLSIVTELENHQ